MLQTFFRLKNLIRGTEMPIKMKVCNNTDYNEALKKRGRIFHLFEEATQVWLDKDVLKKKKCKNTYSNQLIEILAILRYLFKYPYRQLEGILDDYLKMRGLELPVPDFSTLCRRMTKMSLKIYDHRTAAQRNKSGKICVILDSTGINIYHTSGSHSKENSASRQLHGREQTRKLHVVLDIESKDILGMEMTSGVTHDSMPVPKLLHDIKQQIGKVYADAAYDTKSVRETCKQLRAKQIIPPRRNAKLKSSNSDEIKNLWNERNSAIELIRDYNNYEEGRNAWKDSVGYGKRSHVEACFGRIKTIFGYHFMSRNEAARKNELMTKVNILNSFNKLGMAQFVKAA
jgi:transposase